MREKVFICEMSPRDGMQILNRSAKIPLQMRLSLIETLQRSGLQYMEIGSFVRADRHPEMKDTPDLARQVGVYGGQLAVLVPKIEYYWKLASANLPSIDTVALFIAIPERYSWDNTHMTPEKALEAACEVAAAAKENGYRVRAHVSGAFRNLAKENHETPAEKVAESCKRLIENGCDVVALADTDGRALSEDIVRVISYVGKELGGLERIGVHLHDRYGDGLVKAWIAYENDVRIFDSAVGGIGGNQVVKSGAVGNLSTEELVYMFESRGVPTGVDLKILLEASEIIYKMAKDVGDPPPPSKLLADWLIHRELPTPSSSRLYALGKVGKRTGDWEAENDPNYQAFLKEVVELEANYPGYLIAYADGNGIAIGKDAEELAERIPAEYKKRMLFIADVPKKDAPEKVFEFRRPLQIFDQ